MKYSKKLQAEFAISLPAFDPNFQKTELPELQIAIPRIFRGALRAPGTKQSSYRDARLPTGTSRPPGEQKASASSKVQVSTLPMKGQIWGKSKKKSSFQTQS